MVWADSDLHTLGSLVGSPSSKAEQTCRGANGEQHHRWFIILALFCFLSFVQLSGLIYYFSHLLSFSLVELPLVKYLYIPHILENFMFIWVWKWLFRAANRPVVSVIWCVSLSSLSRNVHLCRIAGLKRCNVFLSWPAFTTSGTFWELVQGCWLPWLWASALGF